MSINYPIKFIPILKERIWGGTKLHTLLGKEAQPFPVGESWEVSTIPGSVSVVANGKLKGTSLQELIDTHKAALLGENIYKKYGTNFPLLIKYIDTKTDLSVQLHPNDALAKKRHNCFGKEEMWYIMQSDVASHLYFGFSKELNKEVYKQHVENKSIPSILHKERAEKGAVFQIPTGRVHAIGGGIVLAEIQQSSDITYRLYDWDRKDALGKTRELHTEQALEAIDFKVPTDFQTHYKAKENTYVPVIETAFYKTKILYLTTKKQVATTSKDSFSIYMCVEGKGNFYTNHYDVPIKMGECVFIPASFPKYTIKPDTSMKLLYIKAV